MSTQPLVKQKEAPHTRQRWFGVGHSEDPDSCTAATIATRAAITGADPKLLIVFCSDSHDVQSLVDAVNEASGGVPLIGCSTAGEISTGDAGDGGVVVTAIGGDGISVATAAAGAENGLRSASAEVAECVNRIERHEHTVLLLLTDGLAGDQEEVVRGAYQVVGAEVPLVGGCAGDSLKMERTLQLFGREVLGNAVVGAVISSDAPIGIGVRHGWRKVGDPAIVSASDAHLVHSLDDEPALDVYLRRLNAPPEAWTDPAAFTQFALTHPLGLRRRSGEEVRFVAEADFETRSLVCIAAVPSGGLAWFMEGDDESVLQASDEACADALAGMGGRPMGLLAFDCIARRGVLGEAGIARELQQVRQFAGGAPIAGFYTYGEIARTSGVNGFHNQTMVVLALG